ncbi:MAG: nuclear transport factor 2 family protein [Pseudomonadota bacterium]
MTNKEKIAEAYRLWHETKGGSVNRWLDLAHDDVQCWSIAEGAHGLDFTENCTCKADFERYFSGITKDWELIHYTVDRLFEDGEEIVALGRCAFRYKKNGAELETPKADFFTMRDGKIAEFREFYDTAKVASATGT